MNTGEKIAVFAIFTSTFMSTLTFVESDPFQNNEHVGNDGPDPKQWRTHLICSDVASKSMEYDNTTSSYIYMNNYVRCAISQP